MNAFCITQQRRPAPTPVTDGDVVRVLQVERECVHLLVGNMHSDKRPDIGACPMENRWVKGAKSVEEEIMLSYRSRTGDRGI
jgi:hypothetical protein